MEVIVLINKKTILFSKMFCHFTPLSDVEVRKSYVEAFDVKQSVFNVITCSTDHTCVYNPNLLSLNHKKLQTSQTRFTFNKLKIKIYNYHTSLYSFDKELQFLNYEIKPENLVSF